MCNLRSLTFPYEVYYNMFYLFKYNGGTCITLARYSKDERANVFMVIIPWRAHVSHLLGLRLGLVKMRDLMYLCL